MVRHQNFKKTKKDRNTGKVGMPKLAWHLLWTKGQNSFFPGTLQQRSCVLSIYSPVSDLKKEYTILGQCKPQNYFLHRGGVSCPFLRTSSLATDFVFSAIFPKIPVFLSLDPPAAVSGLEGGNCTRFCPTRLPSPHRRGYFLKEAAKLVSIPRTFFQFHLPQGVQQNLFQPDSLGLLGISLLTIIFFVSLLHSNCHQV